MQDEQLPVYEVEEISVEDALRLLSARAGHKGLRRADAAPEPGAMPSMPLLQVGVQDFVFQ